MFSFLVKSLLLVFISGCYAKTVSNRMNRLDELLEIQRIQINEISKNEQLRNNLKQVLTTILDIRDEIDKLKINEVKILSIPSHELKRLTEVDKK